MYGNPYFNQTRYQSNNNQMTQPNYMQTIPTIQPMPTINNQIGLLGKVVDSIDVVKSLEIPLDGSTSYFPLANGEAIISKQLQNDGTSKIVVYKPTQEEKKDVIQFATLEDIQDAINELDLSDIQDLKDDIKEIKKQLKELKLKKTKED